MQLMDVVTSYLYRSFDSYIYMKVPNEIFVPDPNINHKMYHVELGITDLVSSFYRMDTLTMMIGHMFSSKSLKQDFASY